MNQSSALLAKFSPEVSTFVKALLAGAFPARKLAKLSIALKAKGKKSDAQAAARLAFELSGDDLEVRRGVEWWVRRQVPVWHWNIVRDDRRNRAYQQALLRAVQPGMMVLEIGTGTGILAMLAAQAGAGHVYTIEREPLIAQVAREIVSLNGFSDRITVIEMDATQVQLGRDLPQRADLFVAEIVDNSLLGEDVLPLTEYAKRQLLKPNAILIPREISAWGCLASDYSLSERYQMPRALGFDLSPFNRLAPQTLNVGRSEWEPLCEPTQILSIALDQDYPQSSEQEIDIPVTVAGELAGLVRWFRMDMGNGVSYENRPPLNSCWDKQFHALPARTLSQGQAVRLKVSHDERSLVISSPHNIAVNGLC